MQTKFLFFLFFIITITCIGQGKTQAPFIGVKNFNFSGGSCCNQTITIMKNGLCQIVAYEAPEFGQTTTVIYNGKFKPIIWVYENGVKSYGYKIDQKFIYSLDKSGKISVGCKEENKPCREPLN